jgi:hypothetical protein
MAPLPWGHMWRKSWVCSTDSSRSITRLEAISL